MLYAIVAVLAIIVDQWVKYWVSSSIFDHSLGETFIPGILSLVNVHNDGAAFSFLAGGGARIYFIILTGVFTVAVIIALATNFISGKLARWSIVMVTAGGLSNCIDRVIYGYVEDMFKCELFNFPVFNVADIYITVFAILFVLAVIFGKNPEEDDEEAFLEDDEEDERALRKQRAAAKKAEKKASRARQEEEAPARSARKSRKAREEEDEEEAYEEYKAARAQRQKAAVRRSAEEQAAEAPVRRKAV
ncbi:MAG: signal peptidase II, partial [Oscillospiraceae bacterium]|nr:signal peptidase II [Oscillospiraceae bacterium]